MFVATVALFIQSTWAQQFRFEVLGGSRKAEAESACGQAEVLTAVYVKVKPWITRGKPEETKALQDALDACEAVIRDYPGTEQAARMRYEIFSLYKLRRDFDKCQELLKVLERDFPKTDYAYRSVFASALIQQETGDWQGAIQTLRRIPKESDEHYTAQIHTVQCLLQLGRSQDAEKLLQDVEKTYPEHRKHTSLLFRRPRLDEWMTALRHPTPDKEIDLFLNSLTPAELLTLGVQVGRWLEKNPRKLDEQAAGLFMVTIIERYMNVADTDKRSQTLRSILSSSTEPAGWRTAWLSWLEEATLDKPNLLCHFPEDTKALFEIMFSRMADKVEYQEVRKTCIECTSEVLAATFRASSAKRGEITDGEMDTVRGLLEKETPLLIGILRNPSESPQVLEETIGALDRLLLGLGPAEKPAKNIETAVRAAFSNRKSYPSAVQVRLAECILRTLKDASVKAEARMIQAEHPEVEREIKGLLVGAPGTQ